VHKRFRFCFKLFLGLDTVLVLFLQNSVFCRSTIDRSIFKTKRIDRSKNRSISTIFDRSTNRAIAFIFDRSTYLSDISAAVSRQKLNFFSIFVNISCFCANITLLGFGRICSFAEKIRSCDTLFDRSTNRSIHFEIDRATLVEQQELLQQLELC
jgi:hypothetical protein